jgi:hypothetical protein
MSLTKTDFVGFFAIAVIAVSIAYMGFEITGYATTTDTAIVNVTITSNAGIRFNVDLIDFGEGLVNTSSGALLDTEAGTVVNGTWTPVSASLELENIGNENVSLGFKSGEVAADFIGYPTATFKYKIEDLEAGSCEGNSKTSWTEFTTEDVTGCTNFPTDEDYDEVTLHIQLYIPSETTQGTKTATITATGTYA